MLDSRKKGFVDSQELCKAMEAMGETFPSTLTPTPTHSHTKPTNHVNAGMKARARKFAAFLAGTNGRRRRLTLEQFLHEFWS